MFKKLKIAALAASIVAFQWSGYSWKCARVFDPIKVIKNDWTGQLFSTEVVGELLKEWAITLNM